MPFEKVEYIGDGVYAVADGYGIELRAGSHDQPSDVIYLEPEVLWALNQMVKRLRDKGEMDNGGH